MHPVFAAVVDSLELSFRRLTEMAPVRVATLPRSMPGSGIYLFSEGATHLYVGRSRGIRGRLRCHCREGATHREAAFAFRLARESAGRPAASYKTAGSRGDLMDDPPFAAAFDAAKARIRAMDVRFVEEADPVRQTVLEVYAAVSLQTPYNDFDTH
jgi:hypothetical protein